MEGVGEGFVVVVVVVSYRTIRNVQAVVAVVAVAAVAAVLQCAKQGCLLILLAAAPARAGHRRLRFCS